MSRRARVLEEIGITPRWRLRRAGETAAVGGDKASADARAEAAGSAHTADPIEAASQPRLAEQRPQVRATASRSASPGAVRPAAESGALRAAQAKTEVDADAEARRQQILQMDWSALEASVAQCLACPLNAKRTQTVFGVGDRQAQWLFVGEGPGAEEDAKGEPFVGQAGRLLDNMLAALHLARGENVYIANVVKCRPPNNRNPEPREMSCCEPYLARQIALIRPQLIVALGKIAASHLLGTDASIASLRGRVHAYRSTPLIVTYHPAYLLRSLPEKAKAWVDLCFARETIADLQAKAMSASPQRSI